ncbi:MAG TPA: GNAT family N-acetyltransferase [Steroidobacteraceae bacterium]|jgi:GNAT superfamily N-acetyltransferase
MPMAQEMAVARPRIAASRLLRTYVGGVQIVTFDPCYREEFKRLNVAWLERYFRVEPIDERVLGNPETEILQPGGEILFALLNNDAGGIDVVGTVGLRPEGRDSLELTKMAVDERHLGKGYGQYLLETALELASERGMRRVVLYSQTALKPAINLYYKNGFVKSNEPLGGVYLRCDIKMEKPLG